jgi:hypothetical protein
VATYPLLLIAVVSVQPVIVGSDGRASRFSQMLEVLLGIGLLALLVGICIGTTPAAAPRLKER